MLILLYKREYCFGIYYDLSARMLEKKSLAQGNYDAINPKQKPIY